MLSVNVQIHQVAKANMLKKDSMDTFLCAVLAGMFCFGLLFSFFSIHVSFWGHFISFTNRQIVGYFLAK